MPGRRRARFEEQGRAAALSQAEKAESLNPGFYQNAALRGRALAGAGATD